MELEVATLEQISFWVQKHVRPVMESGKIYAEFRGGRFVNKHKKFNRTAWTNFTRKQEYELERIRESLKEFKAEVKYELDNSFSARYVVHFNNEEDYTLFLLKYA